MSGDMVKQMTDDEILKYWQSQLGLQSWDIKIKTKRYVDMGGDGNMGSVWYRRSQERAIIYVLDPIDYNAVELDEFQVNSEETIVHELLHLVFLVDDQDKYETQIIERGVNRLAKVLVKYRTMVGGGVNGPAAQ